MGASLEPVTCILRLGKNHKSYLTYDAYDLSVHLTLVGDTVFARMGESGENMAKMLESRGEVRALLKPLGIKWFKFDRISKSGVVKNVRWSV